MHILVAVTLCFAHKVYLRVSYILKAKIDVLMAITHLLYIDITHSSVTYKLSVYISFTLIAFFIVPLMIIFLLSYNA